MQSKNAECRMQCKDHGRINTECRAKCRMQNAERGSLPPLTIRVALYSALFALHSAFLLCILHYLYCILHYLLCILHFRFAVCAGSYSIFVILGGDNAQCIAVYAECKTAITTKRLRILYFMGCTECRASSKCRIPKCRSNAALFIPHLGSSNLMRGQWDRCEI